jgi:hypothetical protein
MIEQQRAETRGDPDREAKAWGSKGSWRSIRRGAATCGSSPRGT